MSNTFSQRIGMTPVRDRFQVEEMDKPLRAALRNYVDSQIIATRSNGSYGYFLNYDYTVISKIATDFLDLPHNAIGTWNENSYVSNFRGIFDNEPWFRVYDFVEFAVDCLRDFAYNEKPKRTDAMSAINKILEKHMSGYRFINGILAPIMDENELNSIQEANDNSTNNVKLHLQTSLKFLSDRHAPDYRNSIKESISAVEAILRALTSETTLGSAIKSLKKSGAFNFDAQFMSGIEKIYVYTNSSDTGIRHALIADDAAIITFEDAKFMLVLCSAFVNYVFAKSSAIAK